MNWAFIRTRQFIIGVIVVAVLAAAITVTVVFVTKPPYMTVRALAGNDIEQRRASDYRTSQLFLNKNGTFIFKVVYKDSPEFLGQGYYKKVGKTYEFTYMNMYRLVDNVLKQDTTNYHATITYKIVKSRIEIETPNHQMYYFK